MPENDSNSTQALEPISLKKQIILIVSALIIEVSPETPPSSVVARPMQLGRTAPTHSGPARLSGHLRRVVRLAYSIIPRRFIPGAGFF